MTIRLKTPDDFRKEGYVAYWEGVQVNPYTEVEETTASYYWYRGYAIARAVAVEDRNYREY